MNPNEMVTRSIIQLFKEEPFYAELVMQMDRFITTSLTTAGVCIKNKVQLHINPKFFASLTENERVAVLKHECQHILLDHIPRMKDMAPEVYAKKQDGIDSLINGQKHKLLNVAADCAINPGIANMMDWGCFPKTFGLEDGKQVEWYVEKLKNNEQLKSLTEYDGHDLWSESEGDKEEIREKLKAAVNKAAKRAGSLSSDLELLIDRLNYKPRDWKADLKRFAARSMEVKLSSSRKKRNRRYGVMYPGAVKEELLHIGVAIDTSGSVSDEALCQFMAEIGNLAKYATVTVVEADAEVKNAYTFDPKKTYKVAGRGGTAYQPAFDYFTKETEVDGVIYFGDMDCADTPSRPKYPVIWAVVGGQNAPANFGSLTRVEVKQK